jgi:hypothetical protein
MPCNCDHLEASHLESEMSKVACLLDELNGKKRIDRDHWRGYHPRVYNRISRPDADKLTEELCSRLQEVDVSTCSLEMQIWWRDHQEADKAKAKSALSAAKKKAERKAALAKLTPHERRLLGL